MRIRLYAILTVCTLFEVTSCSKFLEIAPPSTELARTNVFNSDASATAAVIGLYSSIMQAPGTFSVFISQCPGMSADEFVNFYQDRDYGELYTNSLSPSSLLIKSMWSEPYSYIFICNEIIENVSDNQLISAPVRNQLVGEAKFMRALCHFTLSNLFGPIPLATSTDYQINGKLSRQPRPDVLSMVVTDLVEAKSLLSESYLESDNTPASEKVRPNKAAATALLARVYLYMENWTEAANESSAVIESGNGYSLETDLDKTFVKNSSEAILQFQPVDPFSNTYEGSFFILNSVPTTQSLNPALMNAFEPGDLRKAHWTRDTLIDGVNYSFPFKYKVKSRDPGASSTEYSMVLRLSEQYLIRAEAEARMGQIAQALADLNIVRSRSGLPNASATEESGLLQAIERERQVELFTEWGHRWFDLQRTKRADAVMPTVKGSGWDKTDILYPIPSDEISKNPNLTQNEGY